jgi:hypothetical protein
MVEHVELQPFVVWSFAKVLLDHFSRRLEHVWQGTCGLRTLEH